MTRSAEEHVENRLRSIMSLVCMGAADADAVQQKLRLRIDELDVIKTMQEADR